MKINIEHNIKWIKNGLAREMSRVVADEKERIRVSLLEDSDYKLAVEVLKDINKYYDILYQIRICKITIRRNTKKNKT